MGQQVGKLRRAGADVIMARENLARVEADDATESARLTEQVRRAEEAFLSAMTRTLGAGSAPVMSGNVCDRSPADVCVYDDNVDTDHMRCLFCDEPEHE